MKSLLVGLTVSLLASTGLGATNSLTGAGSSAGRPSFTNDAAWADVETGRTGPVGPLNPNDDYLVNSDRNCRSINVDRGTIVFGGRSLTIGDETTGGRFYLYSYKNADLVFNDPGLFLKRGTFFVEASPNNSHRLSGVLTFLSKDTAFNIRPDYSNMTFQVESLVQGAADTTVDVFCPAVNASGYDYAPFVVNFANDNSDFAGKIVAYTLTGWRDGKPPMTLGLSSASFGAVEMQADTLLRATAQDDTISIGSLEFKAGALYAVVGGVTVSSGSFSCTNSILEVRESLTLPAEGKVRMVVPRLLRVSDGGPCRALVMKAPAGSIDLGKIEIVPDGQSFLFDYEPKVETVGGTDFLYLETVKVVAQLVVDVGGSGHDNGSSSLTNAANWSDGELPHAGAHYLVTKVGSSSGLLRTEVDSSLAYEFPGESLTIDDGCTFGGFIWSFTVKSLRLGNASVVNVGQWISNLNLCGEEIVLLGDSVSFTANDTHTIIIQAPLKGHANIRIPGWGATSAPSGFVRALAESPDFKGTFAVTSAWNQQIPSVFAGKHQTLKVASALSIGGPLDAFDPKAVLIEKYGCLWLEDTVDFADLTRGFSFGNVAQLYVPSGKTGTFRAQRTFNGETFVRGGGCLALGGAVRFDSPAGIVDTPSANSNLLTFVEGDFKPLSAGCVDGLAVTFSNATSRLLVDVDAADAELIEKGVRNVKTDAPFAFPGETLEIVLGRSGAQPVATAGRIGLMTVTAAAAETLRGRLAVTLPKGVYAHRAKAVLVESTDEETKDVTFAADVTFEGVCIIVR